MLKLIYTETSLHLEVLDADLANWLDLRSLFANSVGEQMFISAETATFLLPDSVSNPVTINFQLCHEESTLVTVYRCDVDRVEVELSGYWLSSQPESIEGIFVTQLPATVEFYLWELWNRANDRSPSNDGVCG